MKEVYLRSRYSDTTGKLHMPCPHREKTGVSVHVVIKGGYCYRSEFCMVIDCKFNRLQSDIRSLLSLTW